MDDTYLKTIFWLMVGLYSIAIIGAWEHFVKPLSYLAVNYLYPLVLVVTESAFKF